MEKKDVVVIAPFEICAVFKRLKSQLKTDRIYFPGDGVFDMKCRTLLQAMVGVVPGLTVSDTGFVATDQTIRFKGDEPRVVDIAKDDFLVLLDNTRSGFFGGLAKKPCQFGCLITKKGVLAYNSYERNGYRSGFASWSTVTHVEPSMNSSGKFSLKFFYKMRSAYPNGPRVQFYFEQIGNKESNSKYFCEAICHLWHLAKGIEKPFDYDDYDGDPMGDAEDGDAMGDAEDGDAMGDAEDCDSMGESN